LNILRALDISTTRCSASSLFSASTRSLRYLPDLTLFTAEKPPLLISSLAMVSPSGSLAIFLFSIITSTVKFGVPITPHYSVLKNFGERIVFICREVVLLLMPRVVAASKLRTLLVKPACEMYCDDFSPLASPACLDVRVYLASSYIHF